MEKQYRYVMYKLIYQEMKQYGNAQGVLRMFFAVG